MVINFKNEKNPKSFDQKFKRSKKLHKAIKINLKEER